MARRRSRRPRRRRSNNMLILVQVLVLGLILAFILVFRGSISRTTTAFVESFSTREDVRVQREEGARSTTEQTDPPAQKSAPGDEDGAPPTNAPDVDPAKP